MAKVRTNPILEGLSGKLGRGLMFRRLRDGRTILCAIPDFSQRVFSQSQLSHQERFKAAAAYAREAAKNEPIYAEMAAGSLKTAYNVALSDWFNPPEILGIELDKWDGEPGGVVRIQARDDVGVAAVEVAICDPQGAALSQGVAAQTEGDWWAYTVPAAIRGEVKILVRAVDLPGNAAEAVLDLVVR